MTAREDFRAAVREGITYRSSDALAAMIYAAGDAYVTAALLSLAEAFDDMAAGMRRDVTGGAFRYAANMARERAEAPPEGITP